MTTQHTTTSTQHTTTSAINGIDLTMYLVKDMKRAISFYRDTLGFGAMESFGPDSADGPEYAEFTFSDGTTFGLYKQETWFQGNGVTFGVSDIKVAVDLYKERGVKFRDDGDVFETPVCFIAFARDTEENTFMLHQRR